MIFTFLIALASSVIFGAESLAPQSSRPDLNEALKEGGRSDGAGVGRQRLRKALIVAEVALALVLLVGAGLMVKGFGWLTEKQHQGFDPRQVLTLRDDTDRRAMRKGIRSRLSIALALERLATLPGVESATSARFLPGNRQLEFNRSFKLKGGPRRRRRGASLLLSRSARTTSYNRAHPYRQRSRVFVAPINLGRAARGGDQRGAGAAIFPRLGPAGPGRVRAWLVGVGSPWHTIVGVAGDVSRFMFDGETQPILYLPNQQIPDR